MLNCTFIAFVIFFLAISVEFTRTKYTYHEDNKIGSIILKLNRPLDCCTFIVAVKLEDITTKGKYFHV